LGRESGGTFEAFASVAVRRALWHEIRKLWAIRSLNAGSLEDLTLAEEAELVAGDDDPERAALRELLRDDVAEALEVLTDREREVLHRLFVEGWTQARIAREFEVSKSRVGQIVKRILEKLRRRLGVHGYSGDD